MINHALVVVTSHDRLGDSGRPTGFWLEELAAPLEAFRTAGAQVDIASIRGGAAPIDPNSVVDGGGGLDPMVANETVAIDEVDPAAYGAVFLVGGHGTMWDFPGSDNLARVVSRVAVEGVVGAVCHGSAGLLNVTVDNGEPLVQGRRVAAFTDAEESTVGAAMVVPFSLQQRLEALGARVLDGPAFTPQVVRDGRLVTGQNPMSSRATALLVADLLSESQS